MGKGSTGKRSNESETAENSPKRPKSSSTSCQDSSNGRANSAAKRIYLQYYAETCAKDGTRSASCLAPGCGKTISASVSSYSNFQRHYERQHDRGCKKFEASSGATAHASTSARQSKLTRFPTFFVQSPVTFPKCGAKHSKQQTFNKNLVVFIADSLIPPSSLGRTSFKEMIFGLDPRLQVPDSHKISTILLPDVRKHVSAQIQRVLSGAMEVTLLIDVWSSTGCRGYVGVVAQFLDPEMAVQSVLVGCRRLKASHTADVILNMIVEIGNEYGITDKVLYIGLENGSNVVKTFRDPMPGFEEAEEDFDDTFSAVVQAGLEASAQDALLADRGDRDDLSVSGLPDAIEDLSAVLDDIGNKALIIMNPLFSRKIIVRCAAHPLQLCLKDAINQCPALETLLSRMFRMVSPSMKSALVMEQFEHSKLPRPCSTQWNSNFKMLDRILETDWSGVTNPDSRPAPAELAVLRIFVEILAQFDQVLIALQDESTPAISNILPMVLGLIVYATDYQAKLERQQHPLLPFIEELQKQLRDRLWVLRHDGLYTSAACLHPSYKLKWITATGDEASQLLQRSRQCLLNEMSLVEGGVNEASTSPPSTQEFRCGRPSVLNFMNHPSSSGVAMVTATTCEEELSRYLDTPLVHVESPLTFWQTTQDFPRLKKVAARILIAPGSTAATERLFNCSAMILAAKRQSTSDQDFENLVMCKVNSGFISSYRGEVDFQDS